jgi:tRNA (Thr-GGU) A37 N-methylase
LELEDAVVKKMTGSLPSNFKKGRRAEGVIEINKDYNEQLQELKPFVKSMHII